MVKTDYQQHFAVADRLQIIFKPENQFSLFFYCIYISGVLEAFLVQILKLELHN